MARKRKVDGEGHAFFIEHKIADRREIEQVGPGGEIILSLRGTTRSALRRGIEGILRALPVDGCQRTFILHQGVFIKFPHCIETLLPAEGFPVMKNVRWRGRRVPVMKK